MEKNIFSIEEAKKNPNSMEIYECDTCGKKFGRDRYREKLIRNCSTECSKEFASKRLRKSGVMDLYFYRVKFPKTLDIDNPETVNHREYSSLEMDILMALKGQEKGKDIYWIMEKCNEDMEPLKDGDVSKRSSYVKAAQKLVKKGLLRKTKNTGKKMRKTRFKIIEKIVVLKQPCPWCENRNFKFYREKAILECIKCGLKWLV